MPPYTLKYMAEAGYIMGLPTIGEVARHMTSHYDAYFSIANLHDEMDDFDKMVAGHEEESIFKHITDDDKRRMDEELEAAMAASPSEDAPLEFETREATHEPEEKLIDETQDEGEQENKHF